MFHRKRKLKRKKFFKIPFFTLVIICLFIGFIYLFTLQFEMEVLPTAIKVSQKYATNIISQEINKSVEKIITDLNLHTTDFFYKNVNKDTNKTYLDVDTILINNVCAKVSDELSKNLKNINDTKIELPIGVLSGISAFSDFGPPFTVCLSSIGDATVDYETNFQSVGINQINFQVYLNISCSISIINPMYKKDIDVSRKLMLVNTIFDGEVPKTYFNTSID
ncbi:sporulation protein YunB [uncultured Tyzzerella sp.]|uniref:sporulation protein YunB n=1 Tax=uncultured Tyzzerella sp. TaxID=2321398 RepID=UPI002943D7B5|nr:sporulation protein YunB [uncultured Tyzzerella sp.]